MRTGGGVRRTQGHATTAELGLRPVETAVLEPSEL